MTKVLQDKTYCSQCSLISRIIYTCLAALLIAACYIGAGIVSDRSIATDWQPVQGTIVSARPENCGKYAYVVRAHYHYSIGSAEYAGDRRAAGSGICGDLKQVEKLAKETVGAPAELYVNPSNPGEAVLGRPRITLARYGSLALCILLIIAGIIGLPAQSNPLSRLGKSNPKLRDDAI